MSRRFTVTWTPELENELAACWVAAGPAERQRLTEVANRIDCELRFSADLHGAALPSRPDYRVWQVPGMLPSVVVVYEVWTADRIANVLQIRFGEA
jgi:hypothetical protein